MVLAKPQRGEKEVKSTSSEPWEPLPCHLFLDFMVGNSLPLRSLISSVMVPWFLIQLYQSPLDQAEHEALQQVQSAQLGLCKGEGCPQPRTQPQ